MPWGLLISIVTTLVMLVVNNYYFGLFNQIEHLPIIYRLMDSSYLVRDYFVNVADTLGPRYYYGLVMAMIGRVAPLPTLFLVLTITTNTLIGYATYLVSRKLGTTKARASLASIIVIATAGISIGEAGYLRQASLEPGMIALTCALWGIWMTLNNKLAHATALFVLGMFFQPSVSFLLALTSYASYIYINKRGVWQALIYGVAFSLTWILPFKQYLSTTELFAIVAQFRNPHHLLPSTFPVTHYAKLVIFTILILIIKKRLKSSDKAKYLITMLGVCYVLLMLGYVMVEVVPIRWFVPLQTFRSTMIIKWIGTILITGFGGIVSNVILLIVAITSKGDVIALAFALITTYLLSKIEAKRQVLFVLGLFVSIYGLVSMDRANNWEWFVPFRPTMLISDTHTSESEIADFARNFTPEDAVFVTPPNWGRFRLSAERAIVVDFKAVPYQELALSAWYNRLETLYGPHTEQGFRALEQYENNYRVINDEKLTKVANLYTADYAILYKDTESRLPVIFENGKYKIVSTALEQ